MSDDYAFVSPEGTDLQSWLANRSAYRQHTQNQLDALEECHQQLSAALGKRHADPAVTFTDKSASGIAALTQEALTALRSAEAEMSQIASARQQANLELQSKTAEMGRAAQQRAREEAERAAEKKRASSEREFWIKGKALRLAAIVVLLGTLYFVFNF